MQLTAQISVKAKQGDGLESLRDNLRQLTQSFVVAGLTKDSNPYPDGTSVVSVATDHEFGSVGSRTYTSPRGNQVTVSGIPERSFLRSTFDERKDKWTKKGKLIIQQMLRTRVDANLFFSALGSSMRNDIRSKIKAIDTPPNSKQVIEDKGSNNPLIDTGHMINEIEYTIRGGSK